MIKYIFIFGIVILVSAGGFVFFNHAKQEKPNDITVQPTILINPTIEKAEIVDPDLIGVDYRASFAIFTNGTFRVFTAAMYHNQSTEVYIQADNPNIIYVKKNETTWDDFFKTLPFKLTRTCLTTGTGETFCSRTAGSGQASQAELRFYLNGIQDPNALDKQINSGDQLLVSYGNDNEQQIQNQFLKIPVVK